MGTDRSPSGPEAWEAMRPALTDAYGNPASAHAHGRRARRYLEESRELVAILLGAHPEEVVFTSGAELPSADLPIEQVIDQFVQQRVDAEKVTVAPQADDANLLRRLMLDVGGRIPTAEEAKADVVSGSAAKRVELVDRLLASPDFIWHQRNEFDRMLLPNKPNDGDFRKYLLWAVKENRSWEAMFRDMLVGDEADEIRQPALTFVKSRARDLDDMLNDTATVFFGVNVTCAKCHDHPLTPDWKQHHYFGMASFFSRTYVTKKNLLAERPFGEVKFKSKRKDDTKGEQTAKFQFLTGAIMDEPVVDRSADELKAIEEVIKAATQKDDAPPPEKPAFSPAREAGRSRLAAGGQSFFCSQCCEPDLGAVARSRLDSSGRSTAPGKSGLASGVDGLVGARHGGSRV